jgi:hypothetical protein
MLKELAEKSVQKHGEIFLEGVIGDIYDPALESAAAKLKAAIPGQVDDLVISLLVSQFGPILKQELLAKVEQISPEV